MVVRDSCHSHSRMVAHEHIREGRLERHSRREVSDTQGLKVTRDIGTSSSQKTSVMVKLQCISFRG